MILLSLDFETSGLDTANSRIREGGAILWSTGQHRILESTGFLLKDEPPITQEETAIHRITQSAIDRFGFKPKDSLENVIAMAESADALVGQNIRRFDYKVLISACIREHIDPRPIQEKLVIDTLTDIPAVEGKHLQYMLADHMRLNPFPHGALTDALSVLVLIEEHTAADGNIDGIIERARSPIVIVQSLHPRNENEAAKKKPFKFRWNPDRKIWWKALKQIDLESFLKDYKFETSVRTDLTQDDLETE